MLKISIFLTILFSIQGYAKLVYWNTLDAYHKASDSFLIIDVNPSTAPWVWVPFKDLVKSMNTHDTVENRGYVLVEEGA